METPQLLSLARALIDIDSTTGREAVCPGPEGLRYFSGIRLRYFSGIKRTST